VQRERLLAIDGEVQRLTRLVTNLIDVGHLETGSVTPRSVLVSFYVLLNRALASVDTLGRTLDVDVASDLPEFMTDPAMVERVIAVVVGNACRFSPSNWPVRITAGVTGDALNSSSSIVVRAWRRPSAQRSSSLSNERTEIKRAPTRSQRGDGFRETARWPLSF